MEHVGPTVHFLIVARLFFFTLLFHSVNPIADSLKATIFFFPLHLITTFLFLEYLRTRSLTRAETLGYFVVLSSGRLSLPKLSLLPHSTPHLSFLRAIVLLVSAMRYDGLFSLDISI